MNRWKKRKRERRRRRHEQKEREKHALPAEFDDVVNAIVDRLSNPADDAPETLSIEYEINDLGTLAHRLKQRLRVRRSVQYDRGGKPRIPEGHVLLWHGTSLARANSILKSGFRSKRRGVFFSSNITESFSYAERRARDGSSEPALFAAVYDLSTLKYGREFRRDIHYIFRPRVATRIVKVLLTCHGLHAVGEIVTEADRFRDDLTDIAITQGSDTAGIAYWLTSFLDCLGNI